METLETGDSLNAIEILSSMKGEERKALAGECSWKKFSDKQVVFDKESDNCDIMFVVKGKVNVTDYSLTGKEVSFAEIQEGDYFGEIAAIDGEPRSASVIAVGKCELAGLNPSRFLELLDRHPEISRKMMKRLNSVIRRSNERVMDLSTLNACQRICSEILRMATPDAAVLSAWSIYPLPTQANIASRVSVSRETVARVFKDLINGGVIKKKGRSVFIPDKDKLELLIKRLES